jgi:gas vesicle protein
MKASNIVLGTLGGLTAGLILGVLFAPDKGSETRKKIASKKNDLTDEIKAQLEKLTNLLNQKSDDLVEETKDFIEEGEENLTELKKDILGV